MVKVETTKKKKIVPPKKPVTGKTKPAIQSAKKAALKTVSAAVKKAPAKAKSLAGAAKKTDALKKTAVNPGKKTGVTTKRYRCKLCGYIYSPLRGEPHNGIPAGTEFEDLPDDYVCPVCGFQGKGRIGKWGFDEWRPTRYVCSVCGYVYDEKRGEPHRGIKPGTKFEDLPGDYTCPVCAIDPKIRVQFGKVFKQGFEPLNI
jgi:rubredoxin